MEQSPLIEIGLPVSLMIIMAGMGLGLTLGDFRQVVTRPKAMFVGTIAQIVLIPLLAFALAELMGLSPAIAVGIKNATIGLMVTLTLLKSAELSIPSAVYGILMFVFGGLLVLFGRRQSPTAVHVEHG
jgi:predicted Na+-dependent transporter